MSASEQPSGETVRPSAREPLTERSRLKRDQIRVAAQSLFLELGYERATMDAIAAAAGVSKATLYHYYQAKEQLFVDVLRLLTVERFLDNQPAPAPILQVTSSADLEAALLSFAERVMDSVLSPTYVSLLRVLIAETTRFPRIAALVRETLIGQGSAALAELLAHAYQAGVISQPPTIEALRLFIGPLLTHLLANGLMTAAAQPEKPSREELAAHVRLVMKAVT